MHRLQTYLRRVVRKAPYLKAALAERDQLRADRGCFPLGHFHSPIPSRQDVHAESPRFYEERRRSSLPGIDLNDREQVATLEALEPFCREQPFFGAGRSDSCRYHPDRTSFGPADAILLYAMIRSLRPRRIIEVGCGNSSCAILDTNERFFQNRIECTFIDPHPDRFLDMIRPEDRIRHHLLPSRLQDVECSRFQSLEDRDILFVDSSHVSKLGSDVNHVLFEILPRLAPGVHVHVHDIFYPFGYTRSWLEQGVYYNEAYLLRAFLQFNHAFRIVFFNDFLRCFHETALRRLLPPGLEDAGASIWLRRQPTPPPSSY